MPLERDKDNFGLGAFRSAIKRQEGSFMRAATLIMNKPKDMSVKKESSKDFGSRIAKAAWDVNHKGAISAKILPKDNSKSS